MPQTQPHTQAGLSDIHKRAHRSLSKLLQHCRTLSPKELHHPQEGFGYPTIQLQLHHILSAENYWLSVLNGQMDLEETEAKYPTIESLESFREEVFTGTEAFLQSSTEEALKQARPMVTWGDPQAELIPALVILRTQTHIYHHLGQVVVMCKLLGKPPVSCDFPLG